MRIKTTQTLDTHTELKEKTRQLIESAGHLTLSLVPSPGKFISRKRRKQIYKNVLDELNSACELALVYNFNEANKHVSSLQSLFNKRYGRHEFDIKGKSWWDFDKLLYRIPLFSSISEARGTISLRCNHAKVPWDKIFRICYNPRVFSNVSVLTDKAPLQYARRKCDADQSFILIGNNNSGIDTLTLVADHTNILSAFDLAANHCPLAPSYMSSNFEESFSQNLQTRNCEAAA